MHVTISWMVQSIKENKSWETSYKPERKKGGNGWKEKRKGRTNQEHWHLNRRKAGRNYAGWDDSVKKVLSLMTRITDKQARHPDSLSRDRRVSQSSQIGGCQAQQKISKIQVCEFLGDTLISFWPLNVCTHIWIPHIDTRSPPSSLQKLYC